MSPLSPSRLLQIHQVSRSLGLLSTSHHLPGLPSETRPPFPFPFPLLYRTPHVSFPPDHPLRSDPLPITPWSRLIGSAEYTRADHLMLSWVSGGNFIVRFRWRVRKEDLSIEDIGG
jgi:hypothetical protein